MNQPINNSPTLNQYFPASTNTEGQYRTIDDAFSPASEHDTAFVIDRHHCDQVQQCANQREMCERQHMSYELHKDSFFSDDLDRDSYNTYLNSETDRLAIKSRQHHLDKVERECYTRWSAYDNKGETTNSVLEDLKMDRFPFPQSEQVEYSSNSLLDSYKASMEEARVRKKELSILKREKEDYALMSEDNFRRSEQGLRDKEEECECTWFRLEMMQSYQHDRFSQQNVSKVAGDRSGNKDDHSPVNEDTFLLVVNTVKIHALKAFLILLNILK